MLALLNATNTLRLRSTLALESSSLGSSAPKSSLGGICQALESSHDNVSLVLESSLVTLPGLVRTRPTQTKYPLWARLYL
jgi:hypothetical protein